MILKGPFPKICFYIICIFDYSRNHLYEKVWIGYLEQNNAFSWQSGAETTFTSWEDGKSLAISLKLYNFKCFIQTCLQAICFFTEQTTYKTVLFIMYWSTRRCLKEYQDNISFSLYIWLKNIFFQWDFPESLLYWFYEVI